MYDLLFCSIEMHDLLVLIRSRSLMCNFDHYYYYSNPVAQLSPL